jgi:hypothetical protein
MISAKELTLSPNRNSSFVGDNGFCGGELLIRKGRRVTLVIRPTTKNIIFDLFGEEVGLFSVKDLRRSNG